MSETLPKHAGREPKLNDPLLLENMFGQSQARNDNSGKDSINSGFTCTHQVTGNLAAVRVDQKDLLSGSDSRTNHGDTAKDSLWQASGSSKGPRDQMAGQPNERAYVEDGKAFKSAITPDVGD